jgi:hypothetical protein
MGIITCNAVGDCSTGTVAVSKVVDGKFVFTESLFWRFDDEKGGVDAYAS